MKKFKFLLCFLGLGVLVLTVTVASGTRAQASEVDPAATAILKRMCDYLGSLDQFSVDTQNSLENLFYSGHRIDSDVSAHVIVSRPNKLRAERRGDMIDQDFYYNGTELTLYNPQDKVYATVAVPDTFEGMFKFMYESLGFGVPISDFVYPDSYPLLMKDVTMAKVVGRTSINGVWCDHLFFSSKGADFQVWVADGDWPLPLKYVITDTTTPELLSITTLLSNWNLAPAASEADFTFKAPDGVKEISFMPFNVY